MNHPVIRFVYGKFLDEVFRKAVQYDPSFVDKSYPTPQEIVAKVQSHKKYWDIHGHLILNAFSSFTELQFKRNILDVFVVGRAYHAFSSPTVVSICKLDPPEFIPEDVFFDVVTHELLHILLSDNTLDVSVKDYTIKRYPGEVEKVNTHIVLHAIHKQIYLEVLKSPERFELNLRRSSKAPAYMRAWEIVNLEGYQRIIDEFKKSYI